MLSFIYRYAYVYNVQGNLGFDGHNPDRDQRLVGLDWATMIVHTTLALSSIQFRVPKFRITNKPMVIYEEYRQHAMVFTTRCFSVFVLAYLFPQAPVYIAPIVVMAHHLLADRITSIWGTAGNTAVRATSEAMELSYFYKMVSQVVIQNITFATIHLLIHCLLYDITEGLLPVSVLGYRQSYNSQQ